MNKNRHMNGKPLLSEELHEIETYAIRRSEELLIDFENAVNGRHTLDAAHAYAVLALAAGQRLTRLKCDGCRNGCDGCG